MKQFFLCLMFMVLAIGVSAQWSFELWHDGKIVLESGDTLRGQVKYDLQQDLVQFSGRKGIIEAYSARKILTFEIFDKLVNQYRQFYSLPYNTASGYRTPVLFELIGEGKLTVLGRERLEVQNSSSPYYYGGSFSRTVLVNKFYLLKENGTIDELSTRKADFMELLGKYENQVNEYMKNNKLKLDDKQDFIKIIAYYNSLFKNYK